MTRGERTRAGAVGVAVVALLAACDPWRCAFTSHGACVEFETPPQDVAAAKARVDRLLELEMPYWNLHDLSGWRIQFRDGPQYVCYVATRNEGCTDYVEKTMSVRVPADSQGCFEASELQHELGHYALGDPMHSNPRWAGIDAQFAPVVWDRPDAPKSCKARYTGIRAGMWTVQLDRF